MKAYFFVAAAALSLLSISQTSGQSVSGVSSFEYESPYEFFGTGDLDGDGRADVVIVDKESGKYRVGYQSAAGALSWVDCRPSGVKGVGGFGLGSVRAKNQDGLAFTAPDANEITL